MNPSVTVKGVVLLVDDERDVLEGLCCLLQRSPYQVMRAESAGEALALLSRHRVDVVVSDDHMPDGSGRELLKAVARDYPETARILLTGRATLDGMVDAVNRARISRFLCKPCPPADLRQAIAEALDEARVNAATSRLLHVARSATGEMPAHGSAPPLPSPSGRFGALDPARVEMLTRREREMLELLLDGGRVAQIAKGLFLSQHTVRNHLKSIFEALGVHSQGELIERA